MGSIEHIVSAPFSLTGVTLECELGGGHQGRVWRGRKGNRNLIFKLVETRHHSRNEVSARVQLVRRLRKVTPLPCAPVRIGPRWVEEVDLVEGARGLVTAHELLTGKEPSLTDQCDVTAMGRALAELHRAMAAISSPVGRFTAMEPPELRILEHAGLFVPPGLIERHRKRLESASRQLVHGDFAPHNLRMTASGSLRVFDFDETGYGAPFSEVANTLYLALFALVVERDGRDQGGHQAYASFRARFLDAYGDIDESAVDDGVDVRVLTLGQWLAAPNTAPLGVTSSSDEWKRRLNAFVHDHLDVGHGRRTPTPTLLGADRHPKRALSRLGRGSGLP